MDNKQDEIVSTVFRYPEDTNEALGFPYLRFEAVQGLGTAGSTFVLHANRRGLSILEKMTSHSWDQMGANDEG